jgi:outer membrane protein assembly factor BamA
LQPRQFPTLLLQLALLLAITCSGFVVTVQANESLFGLPITEIEVTGNDKTQARFVIKWSKIEIGQLLDQQILDRARQEILNKELFKDVSVTAQAGENGVKVLINLKEKRYWLALPRLRRNADGDIKYGLSLTMDNINGADQSLRTLIEKTDKSTGEESHRYRFEYRIPQYSRPYEYYFGVSQSTTFTEDFDTGFKNEEYEDFLSFSVSRDWYTVYFPKPIKLFTGLTYHDLSLRDSYPIGIDDTEPGTYNRINLNLEYDAIQHEIYRRTGHHYFLTFLQGLKALNSDYDSSLIEIDARFFHPINNLDNFNTHLSLGLSYDTPFNRQQYNIGSSRTIRGIDVDTFSGDALLFGKFEYVKGFQKYRKFRSSLFIDIGNAYKNATSIDITDLRVGLGFGLRWKAVAFVRTDLFVDVAYNPDTGNTKVYAGTRLPF